MQVGIVGAAKVSSLHLDALIAGGSVEVTCVADIDPLVAPATAERFGVPHVATGLERLLEHDLDATHNCTPNLTHAAVNEAALRAGGRHLLSEKPLAGSSRESAPLVEVVADLGRAHPTRLLGEPAVARAVEVENHAAILGRFSGGA